MQNIKKSTILICLFLTICQIGFSQKNLGELNIHGKKLDDYVEFEKKLGSQKYDIEELSTTQDYKHNQTVVYLRKEKVIPNLLVYYTFQKKDSVVLEILYEWDVYNFDQTEDNKQPSAFERALISKYNQLTKFISSKYGKSQIEGNLDRPSKAKDDISLERIDIWKPDNNSKIYSYIVCSNIYKKTDSGTIIPTHKIRLYINNLEGNNTLH